MKPVRSRVKNRKGCGMSQGSGSGLYPLKRMPIVEWVRLLKGAAMGSFTQKHSTVEISTYIYATSRLQPFILLEL